LPDCSGETTEEFIGYEMTNEPRNNGVRFVRRKDAVVAVPGDSPELRYGRNDNGHALDRKVALI
jgi:hypothetical protein